MLFSGLGGIDGAIPLCGGERKMEGEFEDMEWASSVYVNSKEKYRFLAQMKLTLLIFREIERVLLQVWNELVLNV